MNEKGPFKVQYSHDKVRWYGYGADATRPPTSFDTLEAAGEVFNLIVSSYMGLLKHVRIVDSAGDVVKESVVADRQ